jgi:uncharacterized membrane protein
MTLAEFGIYAGAVAIFVVGILIGNHYGYANGQRDARRATEAEKFAQSKYQPGTIVGVRAFARERER